MSSAHWHGRKLILGKKKGVGFQQDLFSDLGHCVAIQTSWVHARKEEKRAFEDDGWTGGLLLGTAYNWS